VAALSLGVAWRGETAKFEPTFFSQFTPIRGFVNARPGHGRGRGEAGKQECGSEDACVGVAWAGLYDHAQEAAAVGEPPSAFQRAGHREEDEARSIPAAVLGTAAHASCVLDHRHDAPAILTSEPEPGAG